MACEYNKENDVTKYAAIFISLVAIIASCYLGYKSHEHNKLSVSPYLDIHYAFGGEGLNSGIKLDNPGLGPAIVESMWVTWKGDSTERKQNTWEHIYGKIGVINISEQSKIFVFKSGNAIKAGQKAFTLFGVEYDKDESKKLERAIKSGDIDVSICYRSLYGEYKVSTLQGGVEAVCNCK